MHPWLSSHMIYGSSLDCCLSENDVRICVLFVDRLFIFSELGNKPHESMSFSVLK
jgi:hypothetical protein